MTQNYEADIAWLLERRPSATDAQQEAFAEKVAALMADQCMDESSARDAVGAYLDNYSQVWD